MELIEKYTFLNIVEILVLSALAIKGVLTFYDWAVDKLKSHFDKEYKAQREKESVESRIDKQDEKIKQLINSQAAIVEHYGEMSKNIEILIKSDRDDIKAWITKEHHLFCYDKGWIDDYSLDCIERRYGHYIEEGGNSYVATLMSEIRQLPKRPPQS